jgi:hypothetical protein
MLTVLGRLAVERDLIRAQSAEGRERVKARSVRLGLRPKLAPHQQQEAIPRPRHNGREMLADIARSQNVSYRTISSLSI